VVGGQLGLSGARVTALEDLVGTELGPTAWHDVAQDRIDRFADATDDAQWIHVDRERAASGPFGTTIAHGFLTLSLCSPLLYEALGLDDSLGIEGYRSLVNYGVNRVRFPAPLPAGSRIRARFTAESVEQVAHGERVVFRATVEREGGDKPVCSAELVLLLLR
jgi:acyl dehydratase